VSNIEAIHSRPRGTGAGAVIGGVVGGVIGNQFGGGTGRVATTALGAVGGAVVGNNIERNHNESIVGYRVSVRLDNGHVRTFQESQLNGLHVGDRVRVAEGRIRPV
jgi:outer membrane lipoprotein SlyB